MTLDLWHCFRCPAEGPRKYWQHRRRLCSVCSRAAKREKWKRCNRKIKARKTQNSTAVRMLQIPLRVGA